jgi:hypothetical protein
MTDDERTTGMGLWTDAHEMLRAAKVVSEGPGLALSSPAYYLASHGVEEAFKAYLRARGSSLKDLKCIGHNLEHALGSAVSHGIESVCTLTSQDKAMVAALNPYYKAKHFEYRVTGYMSLPQLSDLLAFGQRLLVAIKPICEASVGAHRA